MYVQLYCKISNSFFLRTTLKEVAKTMIEGHDWHEARTYDYIREAGWYFKTLAAQVYIHNVLLHRDSVQRWILGRQLFKG